MTHDIQVVHVTEDGGETDKVELDLDLDLELDAVEQATQPHADIDFDMNSTAGVAVHDANSDRLKIVQLDAQPAFADTTQLAKWQTTISETLPAIVSIRFSQVAAFDTEPAESSEASGFVVDAKRGIILTNRHVVCAGPFVGEAIWHNHEEVDVHAIYRDPIHDFGFLRFDPSKIRYLDLKEIELAPHLAQVGLDIRVVGNDAGEKLSILAGSISRLDRNVPLYSEYGFNDFNTFYLQAASSASGGSSGSPVLSIEGKAVGLQAGGNMNAATDFFFPLDRVVRALELIRQDKPVPRGTIQVQFLHRPFDEVRRLGLRQDTETLVRQKDKKEIGMLVAAVVLPKGPAHGLLEEGDVLISVNGVILTKFVPLEAILDDSIGKTIRLTVERGGEELIFDVLVQDLHSITPDRYLEIGGAKLNNLSYQLARQYCVPVEGVHLSSSSGMIRLDTQANNGWIISSVDAIPTPNLDAFIEVFKKLPDYERVPITFYSIMDIHAKSVTVLNVERHWSSFRLAVRNDTTGRWDFQYFEDYIPRRPLVPHTASFRQLDESLGPSKHLFQSMVKVTMSLPLRIEGYPHSVREGAGLILDAERGFVVVGRNIVPMNLGDITLTFADSIIIPGKVEFLHPTQNIAIVSYDPVLICATAVFSAPISDIKLSQGQSVSLVAFNLNHHPVCIKTAVTDICPVTIPINSAPRFRSVSFDSISLDTPLAQQCSSGVLADAEGRVQGLWLSFLGELTPNGRDNEYNLGIGIDFVLDGILPSLRRGEKPKLAGLAAEFSPILISQARNMGLSDEWITRIENTNAGRRQLFVVKKVEPESRTSTSLRDLDLILAIGDKIVTHIRELDVSVHCDESLDLTILRDKKELRANVPTDIIDGESTHHVVIWAGAILHAPHKAALQQSKVIPSRIYVAGRAKGSPAYNFGIAETQWITHVNGKPTKTLDEFVEAVRNLPDQSYVRLKTISFDLIPWVVSVKIDSHYWPLTQLRRDDSCETGWRQIKG
eukprot:jgi/Hompol1/3061/HPOL_000028-RA